MIFKELVQKHAEEALSLSEGDLIKGTRSEGNLEAYAKRQAYYEECKKRGIMQDDPRQEGLSLGIQGYRHPYAEEDGNAIPQVSKYLESLHPTERSQFSYGNVDGFSLHRVYCPACECAGCKRSI